MCPPSHNIYISLDEHHVTSLAASACAAVPIGHLKQDSADTVHNTFYPFSHVIKSLICNQVLVDDQDEMASLIYSAINGHWQSGTDVDHIV